MEINYDARRLEVFRAVFLQLDFDKVDLAVLGQVFYSSLMKDRDFTPPMQQTAFCELTGLDKAVVSKVLSRLIARPGKRSENVLEERAGGYGFCFPIALWNARLRTRIREDSVWVSVEGGLLPETEQPPLPGPVGPGPDYGDGLRAAGAENAIVDESSTLRSSGSAVTTGTSAPTGVDESSTGTGVPSLLAASEGTQRAEGHGLKPKIEVPPEGPPRPPRERVDESSTAQLRASASTKSFIACPEAATASAGAYAKGECEGDGPSAEVDESSTIERRPAGQASITDPDQVERDLRRMVGEDVWRNRFYGRRWRELLDEDPDYVAGLMADARYKDDYKRRTGKKPIEDFARYMAGIVKKEGRWPKLSS